MPIYCGVDTGAAGTGRASQGDPGLRGVWKMKASGRTPNGNCPRSISAPPWAGAGRLGVMRPRRVGGWRKGMSPARGLDLGDDRVEFSRSASFS